MLGLIMDSFGKEVGENSGEDMQLELHRRSA
jgi:hypothetical protein